MKRGLFIGIGLLLVFVVGLLWVRWRQDEPRRISLNTLQTLAQALDTGQAGALLSSLTLPQALQGRTPQEQVEFITKALRDEISPEGIIVLKRQGAFGPLEKLFPADAEAWAKQAGVSPNECVAFRLEKNGLLAEVVLHIHEKSCRVVRCNNVKQMATEGRHS
jgi:hypothetical protein